MAIGEICNREVVYVNRDVTVHAACKLMRHYHVGSLVVVDEIDGKRVPTGILTDRDIVVEIDATDLDPKVITVGDIMLPELVTVAENQGVLETIGIMRFKGVRRVPIVDAENRLIGIVTIDDLLELVAEELDGFVRTVKQERVRETRVRR